MKLNLSLVFVSLLCFLLASCATPEATVATVSAVGATAAALVDAISPLLTPEQLAKLHATASSIDGTVQATQTAVSIIADSITAMKTSVGDKIAQHAEQLAKAAQQVATLPSREEIHLTNAGYATGATATSRVLSAARRAKEAVRART